MTHSTQTVRVDLGPRSYDIEIGTGNLVRAGEALCAAGDLSHAVVMTDRHVQDSHAAAVAESLSRHEVRVEMIALEPGETSKSVDVAAALWQGLLDLGADRRSVVVAVGGGVVGDLAGFVAATFARGLRFFQVPTSLLAQVDSSVGGKVGVNLPAAKNMVGAFHQPIGVLVDVQTLATLPEREYRSGLGEVVKYGVILDAALFEALEAGADRLVARDPDLLVEVVARCCRLKADVVERDEYERTGLRAVLNYGHTFAHAIEAQAGYGELLHGEAVTVGMICAARLAERLGRVDAGFVARQRALIERLGLPVRLPKLDPARLVEAMRHDKKVAHGRLRFVLPARLGCVELIDGVAEADVLSALGDA
jgi:3-dehydroquinate synthase